MATTGTTLARGAIGLREVMFQSITSMAPAGAVALSIGAGATRAGGALPAAVPLALAGHHRGRLSPVLRGATRTIQRHRQFFF
jgi:hypothetical protein